MADPSSQTIGSAVYFDLCSTLLVKLLFHLQNGLLTPDTFTDTNVARVSPTIQSISSSIEFTGQFTEDRSLCVVLYSPWPCSREGRWAPDIYKWAQNGAGFRNSKLRMVQCRPRGRHRSCRGPCLVLQNPRSPFWPIEHGTSHKEILLRNSVIIWISISLGSHLQLEKKYKGNKNL